MNMPTWAGQGNYRIRLQWGPVVAPTLREGVCIVVDVLRFTTAVEAAVSRGVDLLGAGAILDSMTGDPSPEARAAIAAFRDAAHRLPEALAECASGRELTEKGRAADVIYAAWLNASATVPVLTDGAFRWSSA
jgi:phosphosulfolactate phosphohydrolase-like enzyme